MGVGVMVGVAEGVTVGVAEGVTVGVTPASCARLRRSACWVAVAHKIIGSVRNAMIRRIGRGNDFIVDISVLVYTLLVCKCMA